MENEIEQERLSCGAPCFVRKPIKPNDPNNMWKHALDRRINDGSIQDDTDGSIQDDTDGSEKIQEKTSSSDPCDGDSSLKKTKRVTIKWTSALENEFFMAIEHIGLHKATPKRILKFMDQKSLTRAHIASKLQKYRRNLKRDEDQRMKDRIAMHSTFSSADGYINPQHSYNYNTRLGNNNLFNVQPGYGLGQTSFMGNNNAGLHDSLNCMNRRPTYDLSQTGSKLLPMRGNLGFQNGMLPVKEEWRSIPGTSQAPRFGQYGTTSNALGMNYNPTTGTMGSNNYVGIRGDENGDLVGLGGLRVNGNGNGSFSGARVHGTGSGSLQGMSVYGNGHGSSLGGRGVHGTGNGSLERMRVPGNGHGTGNGSLGGIRVHGTGNGSLERIRVPGNGHVTGNGHGTGNGSLGGIRIHGNNNGIRIHDTSNGYGSFGGVKVHGTGNSNFSPDGIIVHGNSNSNDSLGGIRVHGTDSVGGIRVHGTDAGSVVGGNVHGTSNGNGSLGVNFGMNCNFNNNNMSNHGSSTPMFPSELSSFFGNKDQSQNNLIAQTGGVIPALEKPKMFSDHHDINEVFSDTNNSQFHQNQHQGNLAGVNVGMNWNFNNNDMSNHGSSTPTVPSALSSFFGNKDQSQNNLISQTGGVIPALEKPKMFSDHHDINEVFSDTNNSQFHQNQHQGNLAGVNVGMNWNFNNNDMSNHGSSTPTVPSALSSFFGNKDQSQNNLISQTGGVIPALEKPKMFSDHHDINEVFSDTNNSQFHQNQHQGNLAAVNVGMNWNSNNNNMSNHGSSTPMFPSALSSFFGNKDQSQNNLVSQTGGVIPALEKPKIFSDHHDINEVFSDTNNSQFHQNQHQGNLTGVNVEAPTAYPLEDISSWSFNDGTNNEEMLDTLVANLEMYLPTQDMNITNQGNNHEEMFNSLAANPEMHFPTQDMNITNQASLVSIAERFFLTLDCFHVKRRDKSLIFEN
ncbi:uncharacterized membrane protein DDB_G0293934 isoform X1 [Brassica rapa]|uniref:uncharacterized membrane protein DDB_G0293934 isoform X1 n=1 Tax=Brassica campestris TaxID=3711 RepID=UPI00142DE8A6|nr:uncharacterized membrane protein DDB_G0293934 isoform X1 [Brassica rapa]XP_033140783.1 uncharacterized membrane protein DDB_G0293934 isoform X1 [Brassica rapa]